MALMKDDNDVNRHSGSSSPEPKSEAVSQPPANPIPNGGLIAWLQVVGSFMAFLNTWGIVNSFGAFQSYYSSELLSDVSDSNISWIGSIHGFLLCLTGFFTGPLFDAGYAYCLIYIGSFLVVFGMFMVSLCTQYWQVMLAQGVCIGLGSGCLFIPSVGIIPTYFSTRKALATGLAASGSSIAGVIYPIAFTRLQQRIGFPWATRVIAFIMLSTLSISIATFRVRALPPERRRLFDPQALRDVPFMLFNATAFFTCVGLYVPYFYISDYSTTQANMPPSLAFYMVPVLSAGSAFGRILPNFFADKTGPLNMITLCTCAAFILAYCWLAIANTPGIIVFCVIRVLFGDVCVAAAYVSCHTVAESGYLRDENGNEYTLCWIGDVSWDSGRGGRLWERGVGWE